MSSQQDWIDFLVSQNAIIANNKVIDFKHSQTIDIQASSKNNFCDLLHFGIVRVSGKDCQDFLQNQFSNDVRNVDLSHSQINAYCSPKGRVLALFRLVQIEETYLLLLPNSTIDAFIKRLRMFVLMSDVNIENISGSHVALGIFGTEICEFVSTTIFKLPDENDQCVNHGKLTVMKVAGEVPRFIVMAPQNDMKEFWNKLAERFVPVSSDAWSLLDLHSGLAQIFDTTTDAFVPQMLNLHSINAVSFNKGCYPGQEVVARMHYLGKLKRRMYLAEVKSSERPSPGQVIYAMANGSEQEVGKVVEAAPNANGGIEFLAVMQISAVEALQVYLKNPDKLPISFKDLPYSVEISRAKS